MFCGTIAGWPGMWRAEVAGEETRVDVVAAADLPADHHLDALAGDRNLRGRPPRPANDARGKLEACAGNGTVAVDACSAPIMIRLVRAER